nr:uncharacterized protein LOC108133351 [Drosophila bipectinata]
MSDQERDGGVSDSDSEETVAPTESLDSSTAAMPLSGIPSILRSSQSKTVEVAEAPSITLTIPDSDQSPPNESPEERVRRRLRFLELRREHYNHMFSQNTEVCTMASSEELEDPLRDGDSM